jgi:A/G-specific adenine glycosylase
MLQQTRASAVVPYFERFLRLFPDLRALAECREADLLRCWSGLGYYARARHLRRAARLIVQERNGQFPKRYDEWLRLPGVGPYTAAAVASIAFGEPVAVLDGNVARVMARLTNHRGDVQSATVREELRARVQALLDCRQPGEFNQALMELGASVCLPRRPRCGVCPAARWCEARRLGVEKELPVKLRRRAPVEMQMALAVARRDGRILMRRRPRDAALLPGFWELPEVEPPLQASGRLGRFRHSITHRDYRVDVFTAALRGQAPAGCRWVSARRAASLPLTTMSRKALAVLQLHAPQPQGVGHY